MVSEIFEKLNKIQIRAWAKKRNKYTNHFLTGRPAGCHKPNSHYHYHSKTNRYPKSPAWAFFKQVGDCSYAVLATHFYCWARVQRVFWVFRFLFLVFRFLKFDFQLSMRPRFMANVCERNFRQSRETETVIHLVFWLWKQKKTKNENKTHALSNMAAVALLDFMLITILKIKTKQ